MGAIRRGSRPTCACYRQESPVNPEGELRGGDHSKNNSDQPSFAGHGIYPVKFFENTAAHTKLPSSSSSERSP